MQLTQVGVLEAAQPPAKGQLPHLVGKVVLVLVVVMIEIEGEILEGGDVRVGDHTNTGGGRDTHGKGGLHTTTGAGSSSQHHASEWEGGEVAVLSREDWNNIVDYFAAPDRNR